MKNFVAMGKTITKVATAAVSAGDMVEYGELVGVSINSHAIGEDVVSELHGVYDVAKKSGVAFAQGDVVYFEAGEGSDVVGKKVGYAYEDAAGGDSTVKVKLER